MLSIGICLLLVSFVISNKNDNNDNNPGYLNELEDEIEELLLKIDGVDDVSVMLTFEDSGESVYAQNQNSSSYEYVIFSNDDSEEGLKLFEITPRVRGVAVVCNNGNDIRVKEKITAMLSALLGITTNRITVLG